MRTLRAASRHCYLLESAENNQKWGRYSFMGYSPVMEITCNDGEMTITTGAEDGCKEKRVIKTRHPKKAVREILKKYKSPRLPDMPNFTGGLVGYFSYDYIRYAEPTLQNNGRMETDFRDMDLMLFDKVIVFDHYRQKIILIAGVDTPDIEGSYVKAPVKQWRESRYPSV